MKGGKSIGTLLSPYFMFSGKWSPTTMEDKAYMEYVLYTSAFGSLMYAMMCTHPSISQAISVVSKFMVNLRKAH